MIRNKKKIKIPIPFTGKSVIFKRNYDVEVLSCDCVRDGSLCRNPPSRRFENINYCMDCWRDNSKELFGDFKRREISLLEAYTLAMKGDPDCLFHKIVPKKHEIEALKELRKDDTK